MRGEKLRTQSKADFRAFVFVSWCPSRVNPCTNTIAYGICFACYVGRGVG